MHLQMEHNGLKKFPCLNCGKKFQRKCEVYRHNSRVHLGRRDHPCNICGKRFGDNKNMMRHKNAVHKGMKIDTSKSKEILKRTINKYKYVNLGDGSEVGWGQFREEKQEQGVYIQQQWQEACNRKDVKEQGYLERQNGRMQGWSDYLQGQESTTQNVYNDKLGQGLCMSELNNQTKPDLLIKEKRKKNPLQQSVDFPTVAEKDEILAKMLKPEVKRTTKSETHFNKDNIREQDGDVFVMAQKELIECNLCSLKNINF